MLKKAQLVVASVTELSIQELSLVSVVLAVAVGLVPEIVQEVELVRARLMA